MRKKILKSFNWIIGIAGLGGSLYSLFHFGHWDQWRFPPLALTLALIAVTIVEIWCRAERLRSASQLAGKSITFFQAAWANAVGDLFAAVTPARVGGELSRLAALSQVQMKTRQALSALAIEGFVDHVSLGTLIGCTLIVAMIDGIKGFSFLSAFTTLCIYIAVAALFLVGFVIISRRKKLDCSIEDIFRNPRLLFLTIVHHVVRVGILPLIIAFFPNDMAPLSVAMWSFIFIYGLGIIPLPSGGGTVELSFLATFSGTLGAENVGLALLWWRMSSHYLYILLAPLFMLAAAFKRFRTESIPQKGEVNA
ncbi:MAG: flippase-like domain-containing protein [Deltaproteobacteria bacterium]|nr:flippase-like domain-containing protein [Deltaproteobacteria bacterium]